MHHEWKAAIARADTLANSLQTLLDTRLASPLPVTAFGRESPVATGWSRPKVVVECLEKPGRFTGKVECN